MKDFNKIFGKGKHPSQKDIRTYLKKDAPADKLHDIEKSISESPLYSDAVEGFESFGEDVLKEVPSFDEFRSRVSNQAMPQSKVRSIAPYINRVAAMFLGVAIIVGISMYWNETSNERTFADHFRMYEDPKMFALRDGTDEGKTDPSLQKAMKYYLEKDYKKAIVFLDAYQAKNNDDLSAKFYLGVSLLHDNNARKAIPYLSVVSATDSDYQDASKWYLALSRLKIKDEDGAKAVLDDIINNGTTFYQEKARSLRHSL